MTTPLHLVGPDPYLGCALAIHLQANARADECYRCETDPAGRIDPLEPEPEPGLCRACLDEVSHRNETRRQSWHVEALCADELDDLPVMGGHQ